MTTRADREAEAQWRAQRRAEVREGLLTAHPADVCPCAHCGGSGEVPWEDSARECEACCGVGLEHDPMPVGEMPAELDTTAQARASAWGRAA